MTGASRDHPVVYLYCIALSALLLYVPGFVVAAYGRLQVGYDLRQPRTMIDRVPPYARRATWAHENSFEAFALFAPAALMAYITGVDGPAATTAAVLHPIARFLFQIFYIGRSTGPARCDVRRRFAVLSDPDRFEPHFGRGRSVRWRLNTQAHLPGAHLAWIGERQVAVQQAAGADGGYARRPSN